MFIIFFAIFIFTAGVFTSEFNLLDQTYYDLNNAKEIFGHFIVKFEKEYDERNEYRFEVFKENLEKVNKWNTQGMGKFGINQFSDMTFDEFAQTYLCFNGNVSMDGVKFKSTGIEAPASVDWRNNGYVTSVKDQSPCGSCYCFSAIGKNNGVNTEIEKRDVVAYLQNENLKKDYAKNHNTQAFSLSPQQGLDCETTGTCDGGWPHKVMQALANEGGSMREEDYPYEGAKAQCRTQKNKIAVTVSGGNQVFVSSEDELKETVANHGPTSIAICANDEFKSYMGGVYSPRNGCSNINHAVLAVGYGNDGTNDYWIIKNQWGLQWGEQGYMRLVMGQRASECNEKQQYVIMSFLTICLVSCAITTVLANFDLLNQKYYDLDQAEEIFQQFIEKYDKSYEGYEYNTRFEIFKESLKEINELNEEDDDATFRITSLSDITEEELINVYTGVSGNMTTEEFDFESYVEAPEELDYRKNGYVTDVKNQKQCGSCYVFSAIGNIEGQYAKKHGKLLDLSEQQGLDCDKADHGCRGGHVHHVFNALKREGGSMLQQDYPYKAVQGQCSTKRNKVAVKVVGGGRLRVRGEEALKTALANHGPLSVYMFTAPEMRNLGKGVYKPRRCDSGLHAVTLIGYGKEGSTNYWLIKNSWGKQWGDQGYFRMVMGQRACGIGLIYTACAKVA
ncbi:serine-repeat antigen protein 5-like [Colias croceus]|uniref:serine-repeat antigen protein 5-like n=1 Tax=Colias crocea TaxID=72248 RepID=UPI001E27B81F|nr:serine-repeat antigen protein 5-like [Colias croceus]